MDVAIRHILAGALGIATVMPSVTAHAQNPFDLFFGAPRFYDRRDYSWPPGGPADQYAPQATVKSPKYVDYVPDVPKRVTLDKVCQFELASNDEAASVPVEPSFAKACEAAPTPGLTVLPEVGAALNDYYAGHPKFLWLDDGAVTDKARAVMKTLAQSGRYGLTPADYRVDIPADIISADVESDTAGNGAARKAAMMRFDLTLSAKVLTYVLDATRGRVDADRMSEYYDLPRKKVDLVTAMDDLAKAEDVTTYLDKRNPDNPQFRALVAALAKERAAAPEQAITIPARTFIRPGRSDPALPQVIAAIKQSGSAALKEKHADTLSAYNGGETYDRDLVALVRDFQREKGLRADGVVGPNTIRATKRATPADRIKKLELAIERLRWLPRQLGKRYVLLNEPAFHVTFVRGDGQPPLTMRAIVGKPSNQTYFFTDTIEKVQYNPYWNVPRSIIVNEMMPRLYNDPYYLDQMGYEVTDAAGRLLSSADVDWGAYARKQVGVEVRQPPGPRNALGRLKIEFPNRHAIYMHDTPEKYLFKHQRLAFSHGCVRLEHPRVMAAALLGKPVSYIDRQIAKGETFSEPVGGNIPVYLTYFTAWPDRDGKVHYYADVYSRDRHLSNALAKTEAVRARSDT